MTAVYHSTTIWTIPNFLTKQECEDLILFSEQRGYLEAEVSASDGPRMIKGIRNNYRLLYQDEKLTTTYWTRLGAFCPTEIEGHSAVGLNEQFRFYRYESKQRFKKHIDGRFRRNAREESRITFMVYLNDDFHGGETRFENITIPPKQGTALCFIHEQKHEGSPVTEGVKYVIRSDVMYRTNHFPG